MKHGRLFAVRQSCWKGEVKATEKHDKSSSKFATFDKSKSIINHRVIGLMFEAFPLQGRGCGSMNERAPR